MKTMKINDNVDLKLHDDSEDYHVVIDNVTKKVIDFRSDHSPITEEKIQKLVDKLMRLDMITLQGGSTTEVDIPIWEIDGDGELYIETFHRVYDDFGSDVMSDDDRVMNYDEFLNL